MVDPWPISILDGLEQLFVYPPAPTCMSIRLCAISKDLLIVFTTWPFDPTGRGVVVGVLNSLQGFGLGVAGAVPSGIF